MKKQKLLSLAAIAVSTTLFFTACRKEQDAGNANTPAALKPDKDGMVATPYGKVPAARVIAVDNHTTARIANGHLQKVDIASGKVLQDFGQLSAEELQSRDPYLFAARLRKEPLGMPAGQQAVSTELTGTNYPGYTAQASATNIQSFSTKWTVPPVPQESTSTATTFLWNGIDRGSLQPVLMWGATAGGAFYAIANWYFLGGNYFHGTYVNVSPGTPLEGVITYISYDGANWTYKESFTGYPAADVTVVRPTEATGVIECWEAYTNILTQWPNTDKATMTNIQLTTRSGTPPANFSWSVSGGAITTPSGNNTVIVNSSTQNGEVDFYFGGSAPADTGIVSGAVYKIVSTTNNSSVLDVTGSATADGTKVELWSENAPITANQQWMVTSTGNGYYKLQPQNAPAKVMNVTGNASADGTQVTIATDNGASGQRWKITAVGNGIYSLSPACATGSSLDVYANNTANGTKIEIWGSNTSPAQRFRFVKQ
ncbi:RICIN domain-containing protein [Chitinophaga vietnamensis]|uniref:RICIN domain-containing protein n=1 Tax=Chitinophaga vietnamensis TaxID=2593957 RepID=UPI00117882B6|nr:RICIN domain-containing protein [Chitinophaga vietnamensis]